MTLGAHTVSKMPKLGQMGLEPSEGASGGGVPERRGGSAPFLPATAFSLHGLGPPKPQGLPRKPPEGFLGSVTVSAQGTECSLGSDFPLDSPQPKADPQLTGTAPPSTTILTKAPLVGPREPAPGAELPRKATASEARWGGPVATSTAPPPSGLLQPPDTPNCDRG